MDYTANASKENNPFIEKSGFDVKPSLKFGWGRFRPECLQFLNNPKWFLVGLVFFALFQATVVIGLSNLVLPSVEKRFSLTGKEMGIISASNDVTALLVVIFIGFYGDYGNKIKWIGWGGVTIGLGALLFSLPHVLIGPYEPIQTLNGTRGGGLCYTRQSTPGRMKCDLESDSRWYYLIVFVIGQFIMGAGVSPFYSLLPAYLDENVHPKSMPLYMGIWTCATFLGPVLGMLVGGKFLSFYVDITQPAGLELTARDPRWIGAWWLGFVIFGILIVVSAFIVLGFPSELAGAKEIRQKCIEEGTLRKENSLKKPSVKMILPELKNLLTNWTFLFTSFGKTSTLLFVGGWLPFLPKILQMKFGIKPEYTGYAIASMLGPGIAIGTLVGSVIVKRFSLKKVCKNSALVSFILQIFGFVLPLAFLIPGCINVNMAGLSSSYYNKTMTGGHMQTISSLQKASLEASCNINCRCSLSRFAPVCGSDNVTYFDTCHAGCTIRYPNKALGNCSCIPPQVPGSGFGTAKPGFCDRDCKNFIVFVALFGLNIMMYFAKEVPEKAVTLRCVPDNKRAFAVGIQYLLVKVLGLLPGPILFGHVVDLYCRLWQDTCGEKGRCFDYDINSLSYAACVLGCSINCFCCVFYFLAWLLYKPEKAEDNDPSLQDPLEVNLHVETKF